MAPRTTSTLTTTTSVRGIRDLNAKDMFFPCTMHPRATTPDARSALRRFLTSLWNEPERGSGRGKRGPSGQRLADQGMGQVHW